MRNREGRVAATLLVTLGSAIAMWALVSSASVPGAAQPDGRDLFRTYCASCHGISGAGNGPAVVALRNAPRNLTEYSVRNGGIFPSAKLRRIIDGREVRAHGTRDMPVWGDAFKRSRNSSMKKRSTHVSRLSSSIWNRFSSIRRTESDRRHQCTQSACADRAGVLQSVGP
jgi:Cytochrome C oxidase, cbb3-type, subunit III